MDCDENEVSILSLSLFLFLCEKKYEMLTLRGVTQLVRF
jgi:hypothetical protein